MRFKKKKEGKLDRILEFDNENGMNCTTLSIVGEGFDTSMTLFGFPDLIFNQPACSNWKKNGLGTWTNRKVGWTVLTDYWQIQDF